MQIKVKSLQGEEFVVEVQRDLLVSQLKALVSEKANNLPPDRQKLVYRGRTMQDNYPISQYNLEEGCKVHLLLQKQGPTNIESSLTSQKNQLQQTQTVLNPSSLSQTISHSSYKCSSTPMSVTTQSHGALDDRVINRLSGPSAPPTTGQSINTSLLTDPSLAHHQRHEQRANATSEPNDSSNSPRQQPSRFEVILRQRLAEHGFNSETVERIMANLRREINADINSSSLDDLERLAEQKLNISNE